MHWMQLLMVTIVMFTSPSKILSRDSNEPVQELFIKRIGCLPLQSARVEEQLSPPPQAMVNITALTQNILQPVRDQFGRVRISSCFRHPHVNEIGGPVPQTIVAVPLRLQQILR